MAVVPGMSASSTLAYALVKRRLGKVEKEIERVCHDTDLPLIREIAGYLQKSGGKRLRPAMVLLSARACGYSGDADVELGAIVEFIHTATLVHDDIVDDAAVRRGQRAANQVWGNQLAVLLGDYVYIRSMSMSVGLGNLRLVEVLTDATSRLLEGEILDVVHSGDPEISTRQYLDVIERKTAALFAACGRSAAVLADAGTEVEEALGSYGDALGVAFQLVDDLLDYAADPDELGKEVGGDLKEGKVTMPLLHLLEHDDGAARDQALRCLGDERETEAHLDDVVAAMRAAGSLKATSAVAERHAQRAREALEPLAESRAKQALLELPDFVVARQR